MASEGSDEQDDSHTSQPSAADPHPAGRAGNPQMSITASPTSPHEGSKAHVGRGLLFRLGDKMASQQAMSWFTAVLAIASLTTAITTFVINREALEINQRMSNLALQQADITQRQLYQGGYSTRIGVTTIWKNGYTADTRNRVAKFAVHYTEWQRQNPDNAEEAVDILADQKKVYDGRRLRENQNLLRLLDSDLEEKWRTLQDKDRWRSVKEEERWEDLSDNDLIEAGLKYRNAIIECLNAMEAVKAIMDNRPPGLNKEEAAVPDTDRLDDRYRDLITDLTGKLLPFICKYHKANPRETTPPWSILMDKFSCQDR